MTFLRNTVALMFLAVAAYSLVVFSTVGMDFISPYIADLFSLTWPGQFNLDFTCYLLLSGLWVAWRGGFTGTSIALGVTASVLGMLAFGVMLLAFIRAAKGDLRALLLGVHATWQS